MTELQSGVPCATVDPLSILVLIAEFSKSAENPMSEMQPEIQIIIS
jgi:hypothetical protein